MKQRMSHGGPNTTDYGPEPYATNINQMAKRNLFFRTTLWTGSQLQVTLMCTPAGSDIGLERHPVDQYIRVEEGCGVAMMGTTPENLDFRQTIFENSVIFVPAGYWHNLKSCGSCPLKLSSLYAPPEHPRGTVHETKQIAEAADSFF